MSRDDDLVRGIDGDLVETPEHDCTDGWTDTRTDRPRPCPICRPDTAQRLRDQRTRAAHDWVPPSAHRRPKPAPDQP